MSHSLRGAMLAGAAALIGSAAGGGEFAFEGLSLSVPEGFAVEQVAAPPLIDRPVTFDFDELGRLYVADSSGSNAPVAEQVEKPTHRIIRLEDTDGDGHFDASTEFATGLMIPQGTLWYRGSLYVSAAPAIWKLTDTDGDGVAEKREKWFDGGSLTGCANDLHGPYLGRDGWLYWCKGGSGTQTHAIPGNPQWTSRASHIFRARPDGSGFEPVLTGGMDNPVDVVFTAAGERILSCTFLVHPAGGMRDGLIHALYGGAYGKTSGVLDGHLRTGQLLPALTQMGPAAACGLEAHSGVGFGEEFAGDLFACAFNLRTVSRHRLRPEGASFQTEDSPFLVANSADFHPTDVVEDADGSLLVADTGGWYKLCCPTSQLEKPAVLGAIYRVRLEGAVVPADPRGLALDWSGLSPGELSRLLADPRPAVVARAIDRLAQLGAEACAALTLMAADTSTTVPVRTRIVWAAARIDLPAGRSLVRAGLADADATVRQAAAHAAGLNRDPLALDGLVRLLQDSSPAVARAAAEALGRLGDRLACGPLLAAAARPAGSDHAAGERALDHSLIYALIEIGAADELLQALAGDDPGSCGAALVALDQMATQVPGVELDSTRALALCRSSDAKLRDTAWWVAARHPEWSAALAGQVRPQLEVAAQSSPETAARARATLAKLAGNSAVAAALGEALADPEAPGKIVTAALLVCQETGVKATPDAWIEAFARRLDGSLGQAADLPSQQTAIVETLGSLSLSAQQRQRLRDELLALAADRAVPPRTMLEALQVLGSARGDLPEAVTSRLIGLLTGESPPLDRAAAARLLAAGPLEESALEAIAGVSGGLGANELTLLLPALTLAGGDVLVEAVQQITHSEQVPRLRRDLLEAAVAALPLESAPAGKALLEQATSAAAAGQQSIQELASALPPGDAARGHAVFAGSKGACTTCHAMAYVGGRIGPDLSRIGGIRTSHDLLEAIVRPSAAFVRSYEPVVVITEDGLAYQGILREETATEVVLQTGAAAIERIARSDVAAIEPGTVSLMPQGYDTVLSPQELADLVAFLARAK